MAVGDLRNKVEELVDKHQHMVDENEVLKSKNMELLDQLNLQKEEIARLTEDTKIEQVSENVKASGNAKEVNLKINELVREIDKCIAQLNR